MSQISTAPVWATSKTDNDSKAEKKSKPIKLYPKSAKGRPGDEIVLNEVLHEMNRMKFAETENTDLNTGLESISERKNEHESCPIEDVESYGDLCDNECGFYEGNFENERTNSERNTSAERELKQKLEKTPKEQKEERNTILISEDLKTKYSQDNTQRKRVKFLNEPVKVIESAEIQSPDLDAEKVERNHKMYCQLCNQILSWKTKETMKFLTEQPFVEENLKSEDFCFKVAMFYSKSNTQKDEENVEGSVAIQIPNVDSKDQAKERREILLRCVTKKFQLMKTDFSIDNAIWTEILKLTKTFNLTAENVFVDPILSDILLIVLIRLVTQLEKLISENEQQSFVDFCISAYRKFGYCDLNELENFVECFWKA